MTEREAIFSDPMEYSLGDKATIRRLDIEDEYANSNLETVQDEVKHFMGLGFYGNPDVDLSRERLRVDMKNPATSMVMDYLPGIKEWFQKIPRSAALYNIYNPLERNLYDGTPIGERTQQWFMNIADARGIRSRSVVLKLLIENEFLDNQYTNHLSLAGGTGQPMIEKLAELRQFFPSRQTTLTIVDLDKEAIEGANKIADRLGVSESVSTIRKNILNHSGIDLGSREIGEQQSRKQYHLVDAIGFTEYLGPEDATYDYNGVDNQKRERAGAVTFLRNAYDLVRPEGLLVVGNMLDTHPELGLTLNVVQWPHIKPRSIEEMLDIFQKSGFGDKAKIDIYCPSDGVYAVYAIRKPAEG